jgi:hypothetical protein
MITIPDMGYGTRNSALLPGILVFGTTFFSLKLLSRDG